jgi:hypothetical protein
MEKEAAFALKLLVMMQGMENGVIGNFEANLPKCRLCRHYRITSNLPVNRPQSFHCHRKPRNRRTTEYHLAFRRP